MWETRFSSLQKKRFPLRTKIPRHSLLVITPHNCTALQKRTTVSPMWNNTDLTDNFVRIFLQLGGQRLNINEIFTIYKATNSMEESF